MAHLFKTIRWNLEFSDATFINEALDQLEFQDCQNFYCRIVPPAYSEKKNEKSLTLK